MPVQYASKSTSLRPYSLTDEQHASIGRLIRACAEIEDIINLRLADLVGVQEGVVLVFLGRTPITRRLEILKLASQGKGEAAIDLFNQAFDNDNFRDIFGVRNSVAHGRLMGLTDDDLIAFSVCETQGIDSAKVHMTVNCYNQDAFAILADMAENVIPQMEAAFGLTALREKRRGPTLSPHNKTLPKAQRRATPGRLPQAFQESARQAKRDRKEAQRRDPKNRKPKDQD